MTPRERITFEKAVEEKTVCGEIRKEYVPLPPLVNIPTERRKQQSVEGDGMDAGEEFTKVKIVFWVRYHPLMKDDLRIQYEGNPYEILDINRRFHDNSCLITCVKIND